MDIACIEISPAELFILHNPAVKRDGGFERYDFKFGECASHNGNRSIACQRIGDQLGNQRIVKYRQFITRVQVGIQANTEAARGMIFFDDSRRR
jgi:hypothetical protein